MIAAMGAVSLLTAFNWAELWPQSPAAENPALMKEWLEAEALSQSGPPKAATEKWRNLYQQLEKNPGPIAEGVSLDQLRWQLIQALLRQAEVEAGPALLAEVEQLMSPLPENAQLWTHIAMAQAMCRAGAWDACRAQLVPVESALEQGSFPDAAARSALADGLIRSVVDLRDGASERPDLRHQAEMLVSRWLGAVTMPAHYVALQHLLAWRLWVGEQQGGFDALRVQLLTASRQPLEQVESREQALLEVHQRAKAADQFYIARDALLGIESNPVRQEAMQRWQEELVSSRQYSRLAMLSPYLGAKKAGLDKGFWSMVAAKEQDANVAVGTALKQRIDSLKVSGDDAALMELLTSIRAMDEAAGRRVAFRFLAEHLAAGQDYYGLLKRAAKANAEPPIASSKQPSAVGKPQEIAALPKSNLGESLPASLVKRDDIELRAAAIGSMLPEPGAFGIYPVIAEHMPVVNAPMVEAFRQRQGVGSARGLGNHALLLQYGVATLPQLYDALQAKGLGQALQKTGRDYLLTQSLIIGPEAALVVHGAEVEALGLSQQDVVMLVNSGQLFVVGSHILGWDRQASRPAWSRGQDDRTRFRPSIIARNGSKTYLAGSQFTALGYHSHKAYGITLSSGPHRNGVADMPPEALIVDNSFDNLYYGFYAYEAGKTSLIGNEYRDNIVYGIDPHDRSAGLTVAYNTVYGSQQKHGIIASRQVDDARYIGNLAFDNRLSGLMVERSSEGNLIYANTLLENGGDGIGLLESSCNLVAANRASHNRLAGIRIRNAADSALFRNELHHNGAAGIEAYAAALEDEAVHATRDFQRDPVDRYTATAIVGNHIKANAVGIGVHGVDAITLRGNHFIEQSPKWLQGEIFERHPYLASQYDLHETGVVLHRPVEDEARASLRNPCDFREQGLFHGDGLDRIRVRYRPPLAEEEGGNAH